MINKKAVIDMILERKLVAILRGLDEEKLLPVAQALYDGGVRAIECTFDHKRSDCIEFNCRMIKTLADHFGDTMYIGAGTVLTAEEAKAAVDAGAAFIISPNVDVSVIEETGRLGAVSMPGAMTPTEIVNAWNAGADLVKLFPAGELGAGYAKAVKAPLKHIPMLAVGSITPENIPDFLKAGICGFGVGSPILPKAAVESGDWDAIRRRAEEFIKVLG